MILFYLLTYLNCDLNRGCLVYMFSLRFSGSKFLINLRPLFCVRKLFSCTWNFSYTSFCGICGLFILCLNRYFRSKLVHWNESVYCIPIDRALKVRFNEGSGSFLRLTIPELWRFLRNQLRRFLDKINTQI